MTSVKPKPESTKSKLAASKPEKMLTVTTRFKKINRRLPYSPSDHDRAVLHDAFLVFCGFFAVLALILFALQAKVLWDTGEEDSNTRNTLNFYDSEVAIEKQIVYQDTWSGHNWRVRVERVDQSELTIPSVDSVHQVVLTFVRRKFVIPSVALEEILEDAKYSSTEWPKEKGGEVKDQVEEVIVGDDSNLDMKKL